MQQGSSGCSRRGYGRGSGRPGRTVIVDRSHLTAADRAEMWALAFKPKSALVLWLDLPREEICRRASNRKGHKLSGEDAVSVISSLADKLEPPTEPWRPRSAALQ